MFGVEEHSFAMLSIAHIMLLSIGVSRSPI